MRQKLELTIVTDKSLNFESLREMFRRVGARLEVSTITNYPTQRIRVEQSGVMAS
jgi:hypothetical protein